VCLPLPGRSLKSGLCERVCSSSSARGMRLGVWGLMPGSTGASSCEMYLALLSLGGGVSKPTILACCVYEVAMGVFQGIALGTRMRPPQLCEGLRASSTLEA
jgi:hypothetical protein